MDIGDELLGIWNEDWGRVLKIGTDSSLFIMTGSSQKVCPYNTSRLRRDPDCV